MSHTQSQYLKRKFEETTETLWLPKTSTTTMANTVLKHTFQHPRYTSSNLMARPQITRNMGCCEPNSNTQNHFLHDSPPTTAEIAALKEAIVLNEWLGEWHVPVSANFGNSLSLEMLMEPATIDLDNHTRQAKRATLDHYDWSNETEGKKAQRLREEAEKDAKKTREEAENRNMNRDPVRAMTAALSKRQIREDQRMRVRWAARDADVIDLTDDAAVLREEMAQPVSRSKVHRSFPCAYEVHNWGLATYSIGWG